VLAILWSIAILVVCWTPRAALPEDGPMARIPHHDKYIHAGIFGLFAILGVGGRPTHRRIALVLVSGVLLATVSELGQSLPIVNRSGDWFDGLADTAGLLVGIALASAVAWKLGRTNPEKRQN